MTGFTITGDEITRTGSGWQWGRRESKFSLGHVEVKCLQGLQRITIAALIIEHLLCAFYLKYLSILL